ncbi:MAG: hypothetical protein QXQ64_08460 [Candidatus Bathyarchaeia archaeon]|uniref:hypothetical protein n=1 Tax=Candidatus Hadarchaeum sp. TaxID=2883567 RepID=UPI0031728620
MATVICPKCGTKNPANAMNCKNCRINLKFALEHPDMFEPVKQDTVQEIEEMEEIEEVPFQKKARNIGCFIILALVCSVIFACAASYVSSTNIVSYYERPQTVRLLLLLSALAAFISFGGGIWLIVSLIKHQKKIR